MLFLQVVVESRTQPSRQTGVWPACPQVGDDTAALRILALELQDMAAAEQYCSEQAAKGGQASYALLLEMLLHPGQGRTPLLAQACHLLAAQGTSTS